MRPLALSLLLLPCACASTLSTLQTAQPLAPGQVRVSAGAGVFAPAGPLVSLVSEGVTLGKEAARAAREGQPLSLTAEEQQRLLTAGMALAVAPPGINGELMARVGLVKEVDAGLRLGTSSLRLDGKVRLLHGGDAEEVPRVQRRSLDLAVGLGLSRHFFGGPALGVLEVLRLDDFARWDLEVPVYLSADFGDVLKLYGAPKYILSRTWLDEKLVAASRQNTPGGLDVRLPAAVTSHFAGATVGMALGYRYVHLFAELTAGYTFLRPTLFGQQRELGGLTLYPAMGLAVTTEALWGARP